MEKNIEKKLFLSKIINLFDTYIIPKPRKQTRQKIIKLRIQIFIILIIFFAILIIKFIVPLFNNFK